MFAPGIERHVKVVLGAETATFNAGMAGAMAAVSKFKVAVGLAAAAVVILGIKLGASAVKSASSFQQAMAMVKSVTQASGKDFIALQDKATELGKTTKFTMTDIASGMEFLGRAGFKTNEVISAMSGVTNLAAANAIDLGEASDITSNILKGMALDASETDRMVNVLSETARNTNVNVGMLGDTFSYMAPLAKAAGFSLEDMASATGALGDAGIQGSRAGTALRMAISELIGKSDSFVDKMGNAGVATGELYTPEGELRVKSLAEAIGIFEKKGLGAAEMVAMFGKRAGPALAILLARGQTGLENLTSVFSASGDELEVLYTKMALPHDAEQGLEQQTEILKALYLSAEKPAEDAEEKATALAEAVSKGTTDYAAFEKAVAAAGVDLVEYIDAIKASHAALTDQSKANEDTMSSQYNLTEALEKGGMVTEEAIALSKDLVAGVEDGSITFAEFQDTIKKAGVDLSKFGGTAQAMADTQLNTLSGQTDVLRGSWDLFLTQVGTKLIPTLQDFLQDTLIPLVNKMADWAAENDNLKIAFEAFFAKLKSGIEWIVANKDAILDWAKKIAIALGVIVAIKIATWIAGAVTGLVSMVAGLGTATAATGGLVGILTGPVGLVVALGLAGVAAGLFLKNYGSEIAQGVGVVSDKLSELTGGFIDLPIAMDEAYRRAQEDAENYAAALEGLQTTPMPETVITVNPETFGAASGWQKDVEKNVRQAADWLSGAAKTGALSEKNMAGFTKEIQQAVDAGANLDNVLRSTLEYLESGAARYGAISADMLETLIASLKAQSAYGSTLGALGYQGGGLVPGAGVGDIIPAMLEPGEFVIPKWMMQIPALGNLITGMWSRGKKFQEGGPATGGWTERVKAIDIYNVEPAINSILDALEHATELNVNQLNILSGKYGAIIGSLHSAKGFLDKFGANSDAVSKQLGRLEEALSGTPSAWEQIDGVLGTFGGAIQKVTSQLFGKAGQLGYSLFSGVVAGMTGAGWGPLALAAVDTFLAVIDSFTNAMRQTTKTIIELANWIGTKLMQSFNWLVNKTQELAQSFKRLITSTKVYGELQTTLNQIQSSIMNVLLGFLWPVVALLKEIFGIFDVITTEAAVEIGVPRAWKRARRAYEAAAPGQPYTPSEPAESGLPSWLSDIMEKFRGAIDAMLKPFKKFIDLLEKAWKALAPIILEGVIPAFTAFGEGLAALAQGISDSLSIFEDNLPTVIQGALDFFFGAVTGVATFFVDTLTYLLPNLSLFFEQLGTFGRSLPGLFTALSDAISPVLATFTDALTDVVSWLNTTFLPDFKGFLTSFGEWWRTDVDPFLQSEVFPTLGAWFTTLYEWIRDTLLPFLRTEVWPFIRDTLWPVIKQWGTIISNFLTAVGNWITANWATIEHLLTVVLDSLTRKLETFLGKITYWLGVFDRMPSMWQDWLVDNVGANLLGFATGGIIPGPIGRPQLVVGHGGEAVLTRAQQAQGSQVYNEVHVYIGDEEVTDLVVNRVQHRSKLGTGSKYTSAGLTGRYR